MHKRVGRRPYAVFSLLNCSNNSDDREQHERHGQSEEVDSERYVTVFGAEAISAISDVLEACLLLVRL